MNAAHQQKLGTIGAWTGSFQWPDDPGDVADAAAELESLGFGAVWIGLSSGDLALHEAILDATSQLVVASAILNVWTEPAATVAASYKRISEAHPDRLLLGLGASHASMVEAHTGQAYTRPLTKVASYLDELDAAETLVPSDARFLAALGPKALALAGRKTAGAHPYLTTPEHTADSRAILGAGPMLAPEQKVLLAADPEVAREVARRGLAMYLELPNYTNNLRRYGFGDADVAGGGTDRLVDNLVAWGDGEAIVGRVNEHLQAGADHVVVQVLSASGKPDELPRAEWRAVAAALGLGQA